MTFKPEVPSEKDCQLDEHQTLEDHYLKLLSVLKVGGLQVLFTNDFDDRVFQLLLEGEVLARGVQVVHQLLPSADNMCQQKKGLYQLSKVIVWLSLELTNNSKHQ